MTLLELCEPLFQYICRLNRSARKHGAYEMEQARGEIKALFAEMQNKAVATPGLRDQYEKVRLALVFFADFMVRTSSLSFAAQWKLLAEEEVKPIFTGDEMFFDLLDETLKDRTEAATERLAVFYTCMGLGFLGFYEDQPDVVQRKTKEIAGRIRGMMDAEDVQRICPEAYEATNTADLTTPPFRSLAPYVIAVIGLAIVVLCANFLSYKLKSGELVGALRSIKDKADTVVARDVASGNTSAPRPTSRPTGE